MGGPTVSPEFAELRDLLLPKLDLLETRWALFCIAADGPSGGMPTSAEIVAALNTTETLMDVAAELQEVEAPRGALAVANDAKDIGATAFSAVSSALAIAAQLDSGVPAAVAEPFYVDEVLTPCDELPGRIEGLREALDVLE